METISPIPRIEEGSPGRTTGRFAMGVRGRTAGAPGDRDLSPRGAGDVASPRASLVSRGPLGPPGCRGIQL